MTQAAEITFRTDPKRRDSMCEYGAKRNMQLCRTSVGRDETVEGRLRRLEREHDAQHPGEYGEHDAMEGIEKSGFESKVDIPVAELRDVIEARSARLDKMECDEPTATVVLPLDGGDVEMVDEQDIEEVVNRASAIHAEWTGEMDAILDAMVP